MKFSSIRTAAALGAPLFLTACGGINCYETKRAPDGTSYKGYVGDRRCYSLSSAREMTGIWHNEFEGSKFVEGATENTGFDNTNGAWLNVYETLVPSGEPSVGEGFYRVKFIGRKPRWNLNSLIGGGYGHLGASSDLVVVDRFIEISPTSVTTLPTAKSPH